MISLVEKFFKPNHEISTVPFAIKVFSIYCTLQLSSIAFCYTNLNEFECETHHYMTEAKVAVNNFCKSNLFLKPEDISTPISIEVENEKMNLRYVYTIYIL